MINVNKLFRRLSIRAKLVIAFCLVGVISAAVVGGYGTMQSFIVLNDTIQDHLSAEVAMRAEEIQRSLREVERDVTLLSHIPTLKAFIDLPPEARSQREKLLSRLGEEFLTFSQAHQVYYQVRYIDELGREIVRAEYDGERHFLVSSERLQNKSGRYYFSEAMATPPGTIYASPMDYNVERGIVEPPLRPVVRYAVALRDAKGEPKGIITLNVYASHLLGHNLTAGPKKGHVSLASSSGFYVSRSQWHNVAGVNREQRLLEEFTSAQAATILLGKAGAFVEPGRQGRIVVFAPIYSRQDRTGEFWVLLHAFPKAGVLASMRSLPVVVVMLAGGLLVVALLVGVAAARHFTRPIYALIRSAEAVAGGDFDHPIQVETNDELEDLSHQFVRMATHLKERRRQLLEAREHADRKARETEALNRIGMEVLALLSLPQILQLVVDKARELLRGDIAILCLSESEEGLRLGAVSGPAETFRFRPGDLIPSLECEKVSCQDAPCPVVGDFASHVAVVMKSGDRMVGNLCVASRESRSIGPDEIEFLTGLANQATIAIEKARLHGQVKVLTRLEERERIGQDLHDGIIQSIYATGLGVEECVRLTDEAPGEVKARLEQVIEDLNVVIRDVRNYIVGLGPEGFQDGDLGQALADLARGLSLNGQIDLDLSVEPGINGALTPEQAGQFFHICREALTNVVKHALASRVALTIKRGKGVLLLTVKDDGVGFDPSHHACAGQGLRNMAERARRLGGSLNVESAPDLGTRMTLELPLKEVA